MPPLEPIPQTVEAVDELDPVGEVAPTLDGLRRLAGRAAAVVPDLVGVSITRLEDRLTVTLVASAGEVAVLDAVQYAASGPCVEGARADEVVTHDAGDPLDEERWRLFAEATAAYAVRSTLTLPIVDEEQVLGSVNLYAASRRAFEGHHDDLARIFGALATGAVANADLSFATRREAEAAPQRARDRVLLETAVGILAADLHTGVDAAEQHLRDAAARAGVSLLQLATAIVRSREAQRRDDD